MHQENQLVIVVIKNLISDSLYICRKKKSLRLPVPPKEFNRSLSVPSAASTAEILPLTNDSNNAVSTIPGNLVLSKNPIISTSVAGGATKADR